MLRVSCLCVTGSYVYESRHCGQTYRLRDRVACPGTQRVVGQRLRWAGPGQGWTGGERLKRNLCFRVIYREQGCAAIEYLRPGYVCGIPFVYTAASVPPGCPFGVWAAMLKVGMVGDGSEGIVPFTGCPEPFRA